jgi:probable phosphoglycerate mutase
MTLPDAPSLWILRHGETEWNRAGRMQGWRDSPLTDRGRVQARAQAALLAAEALPEGTRYYVSPQGRARATASIILEGTSIFAEPDDRLREIGVGACEGLTVPEIDIRFPGLRDLEDSMGWLPHAPGGEGEPAFRARVSGFLAELSGPSVIVAHGITSRMIRAVRLGLDWQGLTRLPGGQGNIHRLTGGVATVIEP